MIVNLTPILYNLTSIKKMIEKNTNLKIGRCNLVWFNENNQNYKVIKCADYTDNVDNMLKTLVVA